MHNEAFYLNAEQTKHVLTYLFTMQEAQGFAPTVWSKHLIGTDTLVDMRHKSALGPYCMTRVMFHRILSGLAHLGITGVTEEDLLGPAQLIVCTDSALPSLDIPQTLQAILHSLDDIRAMLQQGRT